MSGCDGVVPTRIRSERPRPRVAILGEWAAAYASEVQCLFPTCYSFQGCHDLEKAPIRNEVDVLLGAGDSFDITQAWSISDIHTIIFGGRSVSGVR